MSQLPEPFSLTAPPDWSLDAANYPTVFLVDVSWAKTPGSAFTVAARSLTTAALTGNQLGNHGEQTRLVVMTVARGLRENQVTLVSAKRCNELGNHIQEPDNLPESLISLQTVLKPGDVVVINIAFNLNARDSFASDSLIAKLLQEITDPVPTGLGGIVVIAAADASSQLLPPPILPPGLLPLSLANVVIVGGVSEDGESRSRYGGATTCYGVVPYMLPGTSVPFHSSSAATAYTAGMVLMMLNYAKEKGHILTGEQVVGLLKNTGDSFPILATSGQPLDTGISPNWTKLKLALDGLGH